MLSEGWATLATLCLDMWQKPGTKCICEGVTLSLRSARSDACQSKSPPLRFHPRPDKQLYINFKTIEQNE